MTLSGALVAIPSTEMARDDWFRNRHWSPDIETEFFKRLGRAKEKAQYLRIQGHCLAQTHPQTALMLLEKFFALKQDLFMADALVTASQAYLALGRTEDAIVAIKKALNRERQFPNYRTSAWYDFVLLVADRRISSEYQEALRVLAENQSDLIFPSLVFRWHAPYALILAETGDKLAAKEHAIQALNAAEKRNSGFRYHPTAGLVGPKHEPLIEKLRRLVQPRTIDRLFNSTS